MPYENTEKAVREAIFAELLQAQEEGRGEWLVEHDGDEYQAYLHGDDTHLTLELVNGDRTIEFEVQLTLKEVQR